MHANLRAEPSASAPRRWAFLPPRRALGRLRERLPDLAAAAIGLLLALPILLPERLPLPRLRGADTESVLRTLELTLALRAGHWPPRWMPDALFGLGYEWKLGERFGLGLAADGFGFDADGVTGYEDDEVGAGGATVQFNWYL